MTIEFTVSCVIPAAPESIYQAWLDSDGHTQMTGSPAHVSPIVGESFEAWDGYIRGRNLELEYARRIVQSWRGSSYSDSDEDSLIEVELEATQGGTRITLRHSNVPDDQSSHESGWTTHYFEPMHKYFDEKD